MNRPRVRFVIGAAVLAALLNTSCGEKKLAAGSPEPISVRVRQVELASFTSDERFAATTSPQAQVDLAFRTPGLVTYLYRFNGRALEPGDTVPAGAVLARLRTVEYESRVQANDAQLANANAGRDAANASVQEAQAGFVQATEDLARGEALYKVQAMTKSDLDSLRARRDASQAKFAAAQANANAMTARVQAQTAAGAESRVPLSDTVIRAPFAGVIVARRIEAGSTVGAGTPAYTLADLRTVKLTFGVADSKLSQFRPGIPIEASIEALGTRKFAGRVLAVSPEADPSNRIFQVTAQLPNPDGTLRAGMVASVALGRSVEDMSLSVPLRAIRRASDSQTSFAVLVVKDGKVQVRPVKLGSVEGSSAAISSGLVAGEQVVEDASARINDGDAVTVLR